MLVSTEHAHAPIMAPRMKLLVAHALACAAVAVLALGASAQTTQPAEMTPIPGDGAVTSSARHDHGAACTVDTDCGVAEFCDCGGAPGVPTATTLAPPTEDSPAAPLARTPLATALSFVGVLVAACQQSAHAAAGPCFCKVGPRPGVSTAQNTVWCGTLL